MTKKDIEVGDLVLLRDGRVCVIRKGYNRLVLYGKPSDDYPAITWINTLDDYTDDLTDSDNYHKYDIMAVRKCWPEYIGVYLIDILLSDVTPDEIAWNWEREEVKEVTMAEVEEKFGCKVKIVKEEDDD